MPDPKEDKLEKVFDEIGINWLKETEVRIDNKAEALKNTIKWVFGLGSSATLFGVFFTSDFMEDFDPALLTIPFLLLLGSYALAVFSNNYIDPQKISAHEENREKEVLVNAIETAKKFIFFSSITLVLGMISVPIVISAGMPKNEIPAAISASHYVIQIENEKHLQSISVNGRLGSASDTLFIEIQSGTDIYSAETFRQTKILLKEENRFESTYFFENPIKIDSAKIFLQLNYILNNSLIASFKVQSDELTEKEALN